MAYSFVYRWPEDGRAMKRTRGRKHVNKRMLVWRDHASALTFYRGLRYEFRNRIMNFPGNPKWKCIVRERHGERTTGQTVLYLCMDGRWRRERNTQGIALQ